MDIMKMVEEYEADHDLDSFAYGLGNEVDLFFVDNRSDCVEQAADRSALEGMPAA